MTERPTTHSKSVMHAVALKLAPKVIDWLDNQDCDNDDIVHDLEEAFYDAISWDVYKLRRLRDVTWCSMKPLDTFARATAPKDCT